ncbi:hypothetical protein CFII68_23298 [Pseudomonas sp. CFII68]|nr:hypothetical protein CFII68_23298 [Pseudomonas sp. CFII68]
MAQRPEFRLDMLDLKPASNEPLKGTVHWMNAMQHAENTLG